MRENKFRALDTGTDKWLYFTLTELICGHGRHNLRLKNWSEYTGLKDKDGVEIYEGDVFKFHPSKEWVGTEPDNPCVVFWADSLSAFMFWVGKPEMSTLLPSSESIEIIGNIYENPELSNAVDGGKK